MTGRMRASPMRVPTCFKCLHCKEEQKSEPRNRGRQRYCSKEACRRASKAASQRRWLSRPENAGYFRGKENCERVKRWREAHPKYWQRKKKPGGGDALQETCASQDAEDKRVVASGLSRALQEVCQPQPALFVGLISVLTGNALQDDIAASARLFVSRGRDILGMGLGGSTTSHDQKHTHPVPRTSAARASPV
jgi:hypothetical protein